MEKAKKNLIRQVETC